MTVVDLLLKVKKWPGPDHKRLVVWKCLRGGSRDFLILFSKILESEMPLKYRAVPLVQSL